MAGLGDGSVSNVPALQLQRPQFDPKTHGEKWAMVAQTCNPSVEKVGQEDP